MASPTELPGTVVLLSSASNDLARLRRKNRQEFGRVWDDVKRLGHGTLPPQGKKKLRSFDAFQFDSGRYRVVYSRRNAQYVIWAVFAKPDQADYLKWFRAAGL
mgnify:CR=1 FL=1